MHCVRKAGRRVSSGEAVRGYYQSVVLCWKLGRTVCARLGIVSEKLGICGEGRCCVGGVGGGVWPI